MTGRGAETLMTALGFNRETGRLYDRVLPLDGRSVTDVAAALSISPQRLLRDLGPLIDNGVARVADGVLLVEGPSEALATMLADTAAGAAQAHARLVEISRALPYLVGSTAKVPPAQVHDEQPLDGELVSAVSIPDTLEALVGRIAGDLFWLRPDQWALPSDERMLRLVADAIAKGRRCRAIYPVRALAEGPVALAARAEAGEEIRLLPDVPTRMLVIGVTHAVLPEPLGSAETPRIIVRQRGIVEGLRLLFDQLWERGLPVAAFERSGRADAQRTFLLQQLAAGAQDEQIARRMGISLRTVRRRVAELMAELSVESRFQAGVEAVRRGLL
jgi:hypothetical protein